MKAKRVREPRIRKLGGVGAPPNESECRPVYRQSNEEMELSARQCAIFPVGKFLGKGKFASAYEHATDPSKVVKFTTDADDAKSAAVLKGKTLRGAAHVYEVVQLIDRDVWMNEAVYGIVTERLKPVTELDKDTQTAVDAFSYEVVLNRDAFKPGKDWIRAAPPMFLEDATGRCVGKQLNRKGDPAVCKRVIPKLMGAMYEVGLKGGIFTPDLHKGNWGVRPNGAFAILDFGISKADPTQPAARVQSLAGRPKTRRMARRRRVR